MKIQLMSDLHLGAAPFELPRVDADLCVLAGDIYEGVRGIEWAAREAEDKAINVVYVLGNHEFYRHDYHELLAQARKSAEGTRVRLLERDVLTIGDVRFLGCTLWSDFLLYGKENEQACLDSVRDLFPDFRIVTFGDRTFTPEDTVQLHRESRAWLESELAKPWPGKTVVVTHHAPHPLAQNPRFEGSKTTGGFVSNLQPLLDGGKIDLWISGHTHANIDRTIGKTRLISNQRGYPIEEVPGPEFDPEKVVEV